MGAGGISIGSLILIALIVVLLFGTKKLRNLGGDIGGAVKDFKNAMSGEGKQEHLEKKDTGETIDVKPEATQDSKKEQDR